MAVGESGGFFHRELLPLIALVSMESMVMGGSTLFKAATASGLNYYSFISYSILVGTLLLLPFPLIIYRRRGLPPLNFSILSQFFLLGVIGFLLQICGYKGLDYGSPTLASIISNLTPAFTFVLALIFRLEKLNLRSITFNVKIIGTLISISGALLVTLYQGPTLFSTTRSSHSLQFSQPLLSNWILGGILLVTDYLLFALNYIVQDNFVLSFGNGKNLEELPEELVVSFFYNLFQFIIATILGLVVDRNLEAWKIKPNIVLASTLYMGFVGSFLSTIVSAWAIRIKGPLYVAIVKPLSIVLAVVMGVIFLGDALHLGSVIGGVITSIGFYAVFWGEANQQRDKHGGVQTLDTSSDENSHLLQNYDVQQV